MISIALNCCMSCPELHWFVVAIWSNCCDCCGIELNENKKSCRCRIYIGTSKCKELQAELTIIKQPCNIGRQEEVGLSEWWACFSSYICVNLRGWVGWGARLVSTKITERKNYCISCTSNLWYVDQMYTQAHPTMTYYHPAPPNHTHHTLPKSTIARVWSCTREGYCLLKDRNGRGRVTTHWLETNQKLPQSLENRANKDFFHGW